MEAFIHISEVSPGWIRNIREHIKEGQKVVGKIMRVEPESGQIDLSLKRVSEADKKSKQELFKQEKRAQKLVEVAARKIGKTYEDAKKELVPILLEGYDSVYPALADLAEDKLKVQVPKKWFEPLSAVVKEEIKPKQVEIRASLHLKSYAPDGIERVKKALKKVLELPGANVHYLGAPNYYINVVAADFKSAEKILKKAEDSLQDLSKKEKIEFTVERAK